MRKFGGNSASIDFMTLRTKVIRRRVTLFLLFLLVSAVSHVLTGCGDRQAPPLPPDKAAERDSVVALIAGLDTTGIRSAFDRLSELGYTRYIRTEQFNDQDALVAFTEHIVRVRREGGEPVARIQQADSGGSFDFGFFRRFVSANLDSVDPVDLVPHVIPEDPDYLNPRRQDSYLFSLRGDTLLWNRRARIIEVRARPGYADGLSIRRARYYVEPETDRLLAMGLERIDLALLFREESSFFVHVHPARVGDEGGAASSGGDVGAASSDGEASARDAAGLAPATERPLLPWNTRFETTIRTPFRDEYTVRTVSTFRDFVRPPGSGTGGAR